MYKYKSLPKAKGKNFNLPPRERIIPDHHQPGEPADLSFADAKAMHEQRQAKAAAFDRERRTSKGRGPSKPKRESSSWSDEAKVDNTEGKPFDPWAKARNKSNA